MVDNYCKGCEHLATLQTGVYCCDYLLDTGVSRPCDAGEGCIVHTNPPKEYSKKKPRGTWDKALAVKMFYSGKKDKEIASAVGISASNFESWRLKNGMRRSSHLWRRDFKGDDD